MTDKKRPGTRDEYTPKTPPHGVAQQIAPPPGEEWVGDTGVHSRADEENTPVGLETLDAEADHRLRLRVKETNTNTNEIKRTAHATQSSVDTLRLETKKDVHRLETKLGAVDAKVGLMDAKIDHHTSSVTGHLLRVVEVVGKLDGQVSELVKSSDANRERQLVTFEAHVEVDKAAKVTALEVDKTAKLTAIEDEAAAKDAARKEELADNQAKRDRWAKFLQIAAALIGLATAAFAAGMCKGGG